MPDLVKEPAPEIIPDVVPSETVSVLPEAIETALPLNVVIVPLALKAVVPAPDKLVNVAAPLVEVKLSVPAFVTAASERLEAPRFKAPALIAVEPA